MSQHWWKDDDQLLAALGEALRSERSVPAEVIAIGKAAATQAIPAEGADRNGPCGPTAGIDNTDGEHWKVAST